MIRPCNSMSGVSEATPRADTDQSLYAARALAGTCWAVGVVQNPCPVFQSPEISANPAPSCGATVADKALSPRLSAKACPLNNPSVCASALSMLIVPATAPAPNAPMPPPRITFTEPSLPGAIAENGTDPKNGSTIGTPSSSTKVRAAAFPPRLRKVTPCAVGLAERLSDRRNSCNPATVCNASSNRPEGLSISAARGILVMS